MSARNTSVVVIVDPRGPAVTIHRSGTQPVTLGGESEMLDLSDVVPGFTCRVGDIFE